MDRFLDLGTSWRWVVSFMPWPLYHLGKSLWYPLDRRLSGPQSQYGWFYQDSNSNPSVILLVASRYTLCAIPSPTSNGKTFISNFMKINHLVQRLILGWVRFYTAWPGLGTQWHCLSSGTKLEILCFAITELHCLLYCLWWYSVFHFWMSWIKSIIRVYEFYMPYFVYQKLELYIVTTKN
jgi:hypothetical protein